MYKTLCEPSDTCSTHRRQPTDQAISVIWVIWCHIPSVFPEIWTCQSRLTHVLVIAYTYSPCTRCSFRILTTNSAYLPVCISEEKIEQIDVTGTAKNMYFQIHFKICLHNTNIQSGKNVCTGYKIENGCLLFESKFNFLSQNFEI